MEPALGLTRPQMVLKKVLLPAPFGPRMTRASPEGSAKSRSRSTRVWPKATAKPRISIVPGPADALLSPCNGPPAPETGRRQGDYQHQDNAHDQPVKVDVVTPQLGFNQIESHRGKKRPD